ncbi:hypothetical protein [Pseudomonas putida]|uniref:hypothetical protein n=1 Tax=Pseudomonas putida TaxID=303 RepID=UPI00300E9E76
MEKLKKGLVRIVGKASGIHSSVHTSGSVRTGAFTGNVSGRISSSDQFTFRIENVSVAFKHEGGVSIQDGDEIIVVGRMRKGQLEGYALKNLSTNASYDHTNQFAYYGLWCLLPVSVGLIIMIFGLILTPVNIFLLNIFHTMKYAANMLDSYKS